MQRVTITLDDDLMKEIDRMIDERGYQNRSEAIRDLARSGLRQAAEETNIRGDCVAALVYAYNHDERDLPKRLAKSFHDNHDLSVAATQVYLDHDACFEVHVLRGNAQSVRHLADHVIAERGVRHGRLVTVPVEMRSEKHRHGGATDRKHLHVHVRKAG